MVRIGAIFKASWMMLIAASFGAVLFLRLGFSASDSALAALGLLIVLAFWTSGLFFLERAYVLLVFAGIWALVKGVTDIVRAFEIRKLAR